MEGSLRTSSYEDRDGNQAVQDRGRRQQHPADRKRARARQRGAAAPWRPSSRTSRRPFSALDAKARLEQPPMAAQSCTMRSASTLFVTHDQEEALELADRIVVINKGVIERQGTPPTCTTIPPMPSCSQLSGQRKRVPRSETPTARRASVSSPRRWCSAGCGRNPATFEGVIQDVRIRGPLVAIEVSIVGHAMPRTAELPREDAKRWGWSR